jgi:hypothetical protein
VTVGDWLARREPEAPRALRARLELALGQDLAADADDAGDVCLRAAERLMAELLRGHCTSRESALELLTADALVTYAFEAMADRPAGLAERAADAMRRISALEARLPEGATIS